MQRTERARIDLLPGPRTLGLRERGVLMLANGYKSLIDLDPLFGGVHYGYRRVHVMLKREGFKDNHKRVYRLYKEQGLSLRHKRPKRNKATQLRQPKTLAQEINQIWSMDFVADSLFDGRKLRMLAVVDCCSRESLAIHVGQSLKGDDVVRVLDAIVRERGQPQTIKTDNGSEFISKAMDKWAYERGVELGTPIEFARQTGLQPGLSSIQEPEIRTSER